MIVCASVSKAEDWNINGETCRGVRVTMVWDGYVSIKYDGGVGYVRLSDLTPRLQKRYNYDPTGYEPTHLGDDLEKQNKSKAIREIARHPLVMIATVAGSAGTGSYRVEAKADKDIESLEGPYVLTTSKILVPGQKIRFNVFLAGECEYGRVGFIHCSDDPELVYRLLKPRDYSVNSLN